jgi:hypothetical protein
MATPSSQTVDNALKILGEVALVPGASRLIDGDLKDGSLHAAAGLLVRGLVGGPIGVIGSLLVAANSYSRSTSGRNLNEHFSSKSGDEAGGKDDDASASKPKTAKA